MSSQINQDRITRKKRGCVIFVVVAVVIVLLLIIIVVASLSYSLSAHGDGGEAKSQVEEHFRNLGTVLNAEVSEAIDKTRSLQVTTHGVVTSPD